MITPGSAKSINSKKSIIIFVSSIVVPAYWILAQLIDVYRFPIAGAIFEMLWVFMIIALFALPVLSFIYWMRSKFDFRSFYFYSFLISAISILVLAIFFS